MPELQTSAVTVVLVHGGFVDGGGWEGVFDLLKNDGNDVSIVQNPTLRRGCDPADHRAGQKLCGAGGRFLRRCRDGNDPKVSKLVYIAAFAPDKGESVASLIKGLRTGRTRNSDPAAAGRLSVPRQSEVRRVIRRPTSSPTRPGS